VGQALDRAEAEEDEREERRGDREDARRAEANGEDADERTGEGLEDQLRRRGAGELGAAGETEALDQLGGHARSDVGESQTHLADQAAERDACGAAPELAEGALEEGRAVRHSASLRRCAA
jgi:hypothetical protein